jgi:hypothetical protein
MLNDAEKTKKLPETNEKKNPIVETARQYGQERAEVLSQRVKPEAEDLDKPKEKAAEILRNYLNLAPEELEQELMAEGISMSPEDMNEFFDNLPDIFADVSPEFSKYFGEMCVRLKSLIETTGELKKDGKEYEAIELLADFVAKESDNIDKIKDPETKEHLFSFLASSLDVEKIVSDIKKQTSIDAGIMIVKCLPGGTVIDIAEGAMGKTVSGKKLEGASRVWGFSKGAFFLALDAAGFISAGGGTAASTFVKGVKAGSGILKSGKSAATAYKSSKAASSTVKVAGMAGKGLSAAAQVNKFAQLCGKYPKISDKIKKIGNLIGKYPKLAGFMIRLQKARNTVKDAYSGSKIAQKTFKTVKIAGKVGTVAMAAGKMSSADKSDIGKPA